MNATDEFALQLAVGVKDMFGDKVDEIDVKSKELLATSKQLQQGLSDITAFQSAEKATERLSKRKTDLTEKLEAQQDQLVKLRKEQAKLSDAEKESGELSEEQKQQLAKLNSEVKLAKRNQSQLQVELAQTGQDLKDQERNTKRLSKALEAAGIDTRKFDKNLEQLESELKDVNKELKQTEQLAEGLSFSDQLSGGAVGVGLTAALGAGAVAAYEWDKGLKQLQTTTKLTEEQVHQLKGPLMGLQAKLGLDTTELIGAAAKINQQTGLIDAELANAVESAVTLQRVNSGLGMDIDASEIIRAQTQMRTAWNVSFDTSGDLISTIYQQAGDRADDLLDTFHEYSPLLAEMGLSAEQVSAILIKGAQAGVYNYDYLADTMKEARAQLTDGGNWEKLVGKGNKAGLIDTLLGNDSASANRIKAQLAQFKQGLNSDNKALQSESFSKLMLELTSVYKDDAQKARGLIETVFAAKGADDLPIKTLEAMALGMRDYQAILGNYHNKTQTQLQEQLTGWDRLGIAGRKLTQAWANGVERLGVVAEPVIDMVVHLAEGIAAFTEQHPDVAAFVVALAAGAAVVASLAAAVSVLGFAAIGMKTGMASLLAGARWLAPVFTGLGRAALFLGRGLLALAANPVGLTIMAIAGAGYLLYDNWDALCEMAGNLWDTLSAPLKLLWDISPLKMLWDAGQHLYDWWQGFDLTDAGKNIIGSLLDGALSMLGSVGRTIRDGISEIFSWGENENEPIEPVVLQPSQPRTNNNVATALAAGLAVSSPVVVSAETPEPMLIDTPQIMVPNVEPVALTAPDIAVPALQPLNVTQDDPEPINLTRPETVITMPEAVAIHADSPKPLIVTPPEIAAPGIEPIALTAPNIEIPALRPLSVTQDDPEPINLTPPETMITMPEAVAIHTDSPEVVVPGIESIALTAPNIAVPALRPLSVTQDDPEPVNLTPPETMITMPEAVAIHTDSPEVVVPGIEPIALTAPNIAVPALRPLNVTQDDPEQVNLTPPETMITMPEVMTIYAESPEPLIINPPEIAVPDIELITLKAPEVSVPELRPFSAELIELNTTKPEFDTLEQRYNTNLPKFNTANLKSNIDVAHHDPLDSPLPVITEPDPIFVSVADPDPLMLKSPDVIAPDTPTLRLEQPEYRVPDILSPSKQPTELPAVWHHMQQQDKSQSAIKQQVSNVSVEYAVNPVIHITNQKNPAGVTESDVRRTVITVFQERESELMHALDDALSDLYSRREYLN
ncbi:hypothetical protein HG263_05535 [Pseudoalteromonas sp. JBTF-M23]|uniref:Phage tail tape measure protein domain-containing protein n=1 Tax=Pseudoalteromonas caenipelagi TaxID=2726988 RepID=A0A849VAW6_9GAMM|nr:phage tail tape measure protein [Pseudoalteromonas caenipelagi]NOU49998.1 hypothetical protein [Pseudoalteromonas caenipelagi]